MHMTSYSRALEIPMSALKLTINERVQAEVHPRLGCIMMCLFCRRDQGGEAQHSSAETYAGGDACMLGSAIPSTRASVSRSILDNNLMYTGAFPLKRF